MPTILRPKLEIMPFRQIGWLDFLLILLGVVLALLLVPFSANGS